MMNTYQRVLDLNDIDHNDEDNDKGDKPVIEKGPSLSPHETVEHEDDDGAVDVVSLWDCAGGQCRAASTSLATSSSNVSNNNNTKNLITDVDHTTMTTEEFPQAATTVPARRIGYAIVKSESQQDQKRDTAILLFCSMSGNSSLAQHYNIHQQLQCDFLIVDRPGQGDTSPCPKLTADNSATTTNNASMHRIQTHVQDVLHVLRHEKITTLYLLGVCIGHPYAMELLRCVEGNNHKNDQDNENDGNPSLPPPNPFHYEHTQGLCVAGVTLVAPFVSTACPSSLSLARWAGTYVPNSLLYVGTETLSYLKQQLMPLLLTASAVDNLLEPDELVVGDWQNEDYEHVVQIIAQLNATRNGGGEEARLGVDPTWQFQVCQQVGQQVQLEPVGDKNDDNNKSTTSKDASSRSSSTKRRSVPFSIHACPEDRVAPWASIQWVAKTCYGGTDCIVEEKHIHSHEVMTFLGGPPRNPVLLYQIAAQWGVLDLPFAAQTTTPSKSS